MLLLFPFEMNRHKNVQKESFIDITYRHIRNLKLNYISIRALIVAWNRSIDWSVETENGPSIKRKSCPNPFLFEKHNQLTKKEYYLKHYLEILLNYIYIFKNKLLKLTFCYRNILRFVKTHKISPYSRW